MKQSLFGRLGQKAKSWEFVLLLILILEFIIFGAKNPKFLMPNVLLGSINDIISICIISLFVTFVMITGGMLIMASDAWHWLSSLCLTFVIPMWVCPSALVSAVSNPHPSSIMVMITASDVSLL